jgi:hypothetical protein
MGSHYVKQLKMPLPGFPDRGIFEVAKGEVNPWMK